MPPVSLSISALNPALSATHTAGNAQVPRFKAQQSSIQRVWTSKIKHKIETLYVLVRGESDKSTIRKAEALRERIACRAKRVRTVIRNAPDVPAARDAVRSDMEKLQRDEQKLQRLTHGVANLGTVLAEQSTNRYLRDTTPKQDSRRKEKLDKLNRPLTTIRNDSAAMHRIWDAMQREKTLEATKDRIPAFYGLYSSCTDQGELPPVSLDILKDLFSLSESLQELSPRGDDAENFLYPALKLAYERNRSAPDGENDRTLQNMLRDLSNRHENKGLRAQLGWKSQAGALTFHLMGQKNLSSSGKGQQAQRDNLVGELNTLLKGMADAGRRIQRDELMAQTSKWASTVQSHLIQETEILYASARNWLKQGGADPILHMRRPADAVAVLLDNAIDQALDETSEKHYGLLLKEIRVYLSRATINIDLALKARHVQDYMTSEQIAGLRRDLLKAVVTASGIHSRIKQLEQIDLSPDSRSTGKSKSADTHKEVLKPIPPVFQEVKLRGELRWAAKRQQQGANRRQDNLKREVTNVLLACLNGTQTIPAKKMTALIDAYNALKPGKETWRELLDDVTASPHISAQLLTLNTGVLRQHVLGQLNLLADVDGGAVSKAADRLLRDVWSSVKASTTRREVAPSMKDLCAMLASPQIREMLASPEEMSDKAKGQLFSRINELRGWIAGLNVQVSNDTLLDAAIRSLSHQELGTLLGALATPRSDANTRSQTATDGPPAYEPQTRIGRLLADDLAGNHQDLVEKTDRFLMELNDAARRQLNVRLNTLEYALLPGFNKSFRAEAGKIYQLLNTQNACRINGTSAAMELERLIRESIPRELRDNPQDGPISKRPSETRAARFLRTGRGYMTRAHLTRGLRYEFAKLQKQLLAGQNLLQMASYQSDMQIQAWQNAAVERILQRSEIHRALDRLNHRMPDLWSDRKPFATAPENPDHVYARIDEYPGDAGGYEIPRNRGFAATPSPVSGASSQAGAEDMSSLMNYEFPGLDEIEGRQAAVYDAVPGLPVDGARVLVPTRVAPPPPKSTKAKEENPYDIAADSDYDEVATVASGTTNPRTENVPPRPPMHGQRPIAGAGANQRRSSATGTSIGNDPVSGFKNGRTGMKPADPIENAQRDMHAQMRAELLARTARRNAASSPESGAGPQPRQQEPAIVRSAGNSPTPPSDSILSALSSKLDTIRKQVSDDSDDESGLGSGLDGDEEWLD